MSGYGDVELTRSADGHVTVGRCDPVIGIALELLSQSDREQLRFSGRDGTLTIAGQVRYRPVRIDGAVLVCEYIGRCAE